MVQGRVRQAAGVVARVGHPVGGVARIVGFELQNSRTLPTGETAAPDFVTLFAILGWSNRNPTRWSIMENTILVVEDQADLQEALALNLQNAGYKVLRAGTVKQAEALVNAHLPQLVLLDWMLPDA